MKCLYCGKRLALLRKLTDTEFCSDGHRKAYHQEHERMALERLMDAQKRFSAFTGAGVANPTVPSKPVTKRNSKIEAAPPPPPAGDELKGFLPIEPVERQLRNFWRFRPEAIPQMPELFLPERRTELDAFPREGVIAAIERLETLARVPATANRLRVDPGVVSAAVEPELPQLKRPITQRGAGVPKSTEPLPVLAAEPMKPAAALPGEGLGLEPELPQRKRPITQRGVAKPAPEKPRNDDRMPAMRLRAEQLTRACWGVEPAPNTLLPALWEPLQIAGLQALPHAQVLDTAHGDPARFLSAIERTGTPPAPNSLPLSAGVSQARVFTPLLSSLTPAPSATPRALRVNGARPGAALQLIDFRGKPWTRHPVAAALRPVGAAAFASDASEPVADGAPPPAGMLYDRDAVVRSAPVLVHSSSDRIAPACEPESLPQAAARPIWAAPASAAAQVSYQLDLASHAPSVRPLQVLAPTGSDCRVSSTVGVHVEVAVPNLRPRLQVVAGTPAIRPQHAAVNSSHGEPGGPLSASAAPRKRDLWLAADEHGRTLAHTPSHSARPNPTELRAFDPLYPLQNPACHDSSTGAMKAVDAGAPEPSVISVQLARCGHWAAVSPPATELSAATEPHPLAAVPAAGDPQSRMRPAPEAPAPLTISEESPENRLETVRPSVNFPVSGDCAPEASHWLFPDAVRLSEALPPAGNIAMQELAALWPDAAALKPRLRAAIAEDEELREAVRELREAMGSARSRWVPNLRMPQISFQFSRPDWKWSVMSVPVLLLLAVYAITNQPGRRQMASVAGDAAVATGDGLVATSHAGKPAAAGTRQPLSTGGGQAAGFLDTMQQSIERRAAISFSDDFRSGLADWEGSGEWSREWSYDAAGFLKTGPLALYKPSLTLSDYRMEFLGQIARKSIGWVYRARDSKNYYATKITLVRNGPLPSAVIDRYAVVDGKQSRRTQVPLPLSVREDTLYRIRMDVRGDGFTLTVQGQVVDHWSDDRIKEGGIGFFSAKGEQARLRWVEISHQSDFLGKLCAFLAPYNLPSKDGSLR